MTGTSTTGPTAGPTTDDCGGLSTADLARVWIELAERGWLADPADATRWTWPVGQSECGVHMFHPGATIYFDGEEPQEGLLVEGPLLDDTSSQLLQYFSVGDLLGSLDRIQRWRFPQTAATVDADHLRKPSSQEGPAGA